MHRWRTSCVDVPRCTWQCAWGTTSCLSSCNCARQLRRHRPHPPRPTALLLLLPHRPLQRRHLAVELSSTSCATWVRASTLAAFRAPWVPSSKMARAGLVAMLPLSCTFFATYLVPARAGAVLSLQRAPRLRRHNRPRLLLQLPAIMAPL